MNPWAIAALLLALSLLVGGALAWAIWFSGWPGDNGPVDDP